MNPLSCYIEGVALIAPGLPDWEAAQPVLRGEAAYVAAPTVLPAANQLPPAERRRASQVVRLALALGSAACAMSGRDPAALPSVFSSADGDGHNCHALCETLASDDPLVSPTRFHNSVHNAAAGYWTIASGATGPCSILAGFDASFGAGLLEAAALVATRAEPVLLVAFEGDHPWPIRAIREIPDATGIALVLAPEAGPTSLARLGLGFGSAPATTLADPGLETLRLAVPAARGLPLLRALARKDWGGMVLDYLAGPQLALELAPC